MSKIITQNEPNICIDYMDSNIYLKEICEKYKISISTIRNIAIRNNLPLKKPITKYKRKAKYKINENYFENIDCENKAYWLGFIAADFHLGMNSRNNSLFLMGDLKSTDIEILKSLKKDLEDEQEIKIITRFSEITNKSYEKCILKICSQKICNDIISHGITRNKSKELSIPNISYDLIRHFIRGYSDGDGSFTIHNELSLVFTLISSTESIIKEIDAHLKENCKINNPKINRLNDGRAYSIAYEGNLQVREIYKYLYNESTLYLKRKYHKATIHLMNRNLL